MVLWFYGKSFRINKRVLWTERSPKVTWKHRRISTLSSQYSWGEHKLVQCVWEIHIGEWDVIGPQSLWVNGLDKNTNKYILRIVWVFVKVQYHQWDTYLHQKISWSLVVIIMYSLGQRSFFSLQIIDRNYLKKRIRIMV